MNGGLALLAPLGLIGLLAVAAIVILHMRRRTPPAISLPSLRFWQAAEEDQADRNRLRRPPLTVPLILQVLAATALALGLARPVVDDVLGGFGQRTEPEHLIVVLDGSTSMNATPSGASTRWELARREAADLLSDWQEGDVTTVVIAGGRLDTFSASTRVQLDAAVARIEREPVPGGQMDLDAALELTSSLLLPGRANRVVVLTDGAVRADPAIAASVGTTIELRIIGEEETDLPNYAITQVGARPVSARSDQYRLSMTVTSFDASPARIPFRVVARGAEVVVSEVDLPAGSSRAVAVNLPPGVDSTEVSIQVDDGMSVDNRATVLLDEAGLSALNILLLSDAPGPLERALSVIPGASVDVWETTTPGLAALAQPYDLVVFEGATPPPNDIPAKPMVFVHPQAMDGAFSASGVLSGPEIRQVVIGDPMLEGVDLAGVTFADVPAYTLPDSAQILVEGASGSQTGPLIWRGTLADQPYVALGFDIATSNISQRVAFPVLVSRLVTGLTEEPLPDTVAIGEPVVYRPGTAAATVEFTTPAGTTERLTHVPPGAGSTTGVASGVASGVTFESTGMAGIYTVRELRDDGSVAAEGAFVVNAGHPVESDLRQRPGLEEALVGGAADAGEGAASRVADLWPFLIAAATLLILGEWLVWIGTVSRVTTRTRFMVRRPRLARPLRPVRARTRS